MPAILADTIQNDFLHTKVCIKLETEFTEKGAKKTPNKKVLRSSVVVYKPIDEVFIDHRTLHKRHFTYRGVEVETQRHVQ